MVSFDDFTTTSSTITPAVVSGFTDSSILECSPPSGAIVAYDASESDWSDNALLSTKKRKPGRPKKRNSLKASGVTETIFAKNPKTIGLLKLADDQDDLTLCKDKNIQLNSKTPMKPIFLEEEWFVRRSERIFLSDSSPQTSPNSMLPSPGSSVTSHSTPHTCTTHVHSQSVLTTRSNTNSVPIGMEQQKQTKVTHPKKKSHNNTQMRVILHPPSSDSDSTGDDVPLSKLSARTQSARSCVLKPADLRNGVRVLYYIEGLFYEGVIKEITPPDVYGVLVDGERGSRPHILSQEEILHKAILDVKPPRLDLGERTRICAYWSDQFSCLHPGHVAKDKVESPPSDICLISVEFDDGDSGTIPMDYIRMLPQDFPLVSHESQPILTLCTRRKRGTSEDADLLSAKFCTTTRSPQYHKTSQKLSGTASYHNPSLTEDDDVFGENAECTFGKSGRKLQTFSDVSRMKPHGVLKLSSTSKGFKHDNLWWNRTIPTSTSFTQQRGFDTIKFKRSVTGENGFINKHGTVFSRKMIGSLAMKSTRVRQKKKKSLVTRPTQKCEEENSANVDDSMPQLVFIKEFWQWSGKGTRRPGLKGRAKKQYYKAIQRGSEIIQVGDYAVFLSVGRPSLPYVGRIRYMWESWCGKMVVKVTWLYHPEEAKGSKLLLYPQGALYESSHFDENDVQTVSHRCEVVSLSDYHLRVAHAARTKQPIRRHTLFYIAGEYDPTFGIVTYAAGVR